MSSQERWQFSFNCGCLLWGKQLKAPEQLLSRYCGKTVLSTTSTTNSKVLRTTDIWTLLLHNTCATSSADKDRVIQSKAPVQLLSGPCGEIVLSTFAYSHLGRELTLQQDDNLQMWHKDKNTEVMKHSGHTQMLKHERRYMITTRDGDCNYCWCRWPVLSPQP